MMALAHGIDISYSQEQFDFEVNPDEIQFVMIRASNGSKLKDSKFDTFVQATAKVPIRGAYHYFRSGKSPVKSYYESKPDDHIWYTWKDQAQHFLKIIGDNRFDFYALDLEVNDIPVRRQNSPPDSETVLRADNVIDEKTSKDARLWMEFVADKTGKQVLIYTNLSLYQQHFKWMSKWPLWIATWSGDPAREPNLPEGAPKWRFNQYKVTNEGHKYGVSNKSGRTLDLNVFNGDLADLLRWLKLPEGAQLSPPEQTPDEPAPPAVQAPRARPTWKEVFRAVHAVAQNRDSFAVTWFREAGIKLPDDDGWNDEYVGPPIEKWPISFGEDREQIRQEVLQRLGQ
jgi:GH25 family lysozyme M1 (1,4-beta-N-acetylmuramidase)